MTTLSPYRVMRIRTAMFDTTVDVHGRDGSLARAALPAHFAHPDLEGLSAPNRKELAPIRQLMWDGDYFLPADAYIVDKQGLRWNAIEGTWASFGWGGVVAWRQCDVQLVVVDG